VYPGPIGAVLTPQLTGASASLPFASSLCGACFDACPVRIDIPTLLVHLRTRTAEDHRLPTPEAIGMAAAAWMMAGPGRFRFGSRLLRLGRLLSRRGSIRRLPPPLSGWTQARDAPAPAPQSFRDWWRSR
jgi:L-lactate dehydrogenase complex protein LldF